MALAATQSSAPTQLHSLPHQGKPLPEIIDDYLKRESVSSLRCVAIGVAAPLENDGWVRMTNAPYAFEIESLRRQLGADRIRVVNDFEALGIGIPLLGPADYEVLSAGRACPGAPMLVIGPGTGLGMAIVIPAQERWLALATEGGHATLASPVARLDPLICAVRQRFGHASAERLLCGHGLGLIDAYLATGELGDGLRDAAAIDRAAAEGEARALQAIGDFFELLAGFAGSAALMTGARGGVCFAGGIMPRLRDRLDGATFCRRFADKGRYRSWLEAIPLRLVTDPTVSLRGLAALCD